MARSNPEGGEPNLLAEVIRAVSVYANKPPTALPPLGETIDPDALESLFQPAADGEPSDLREVVFEYAGFRVRISASDGVKVRALEKAD